MGKIFKRHSDILVSRFCSLLLIWDFHGKARIVHNSGLEHFDRRCVRGKRKLYLRKGGHLSHPKVSWHACQPIACFCS